MRVTRILFLFYLFIFTISCSDKKSYFVVQGEIEGVDNDVLYLEKRELNKFTTLDSVLLNKQGMFRFKLEVLPYHEFYVLKLNNQVINVVSDSTESITIEASKNKFAIDYNIKGSDVNLDIKNLVLAKYKVDTTIKELQNKLYNKQISDAQYIMSIDTVNKEYKNMASEIIIKDLKSPAAYFALFQKIDNYLLFDPYDKKDSKIFVAIANVWDFYYPQSPRTEQLKKFALETMKIRKQEEIKPIDLEAALSIDPQSYFNIELPDVDNNKISLKSLRGKLVLLDFIDYQSDISPQHNMKLNSLYSKYKDIIEIYQVSLDADKHLWKNAASNIPWIAVYDRRSLNSPLIERYNIQNLPTIYLIDKEGEIKRRIYDEDDLEKEIIKLF